MALGAENAASKPAPLAALPAKVAAPADNPSSPEKEALGRQLFFDPRLSGNNRMSCATCHLPDKGLADGLAATPGWDGKPLGRNTPGLLNVGFQTSLFWDGRAGSLEEQALGPIQSPQEMHQDLDELERELNVIGGYAEQFRRIFGTGATRENVARALAAFERTLISRSSPFDRYLAGDKDALTASAKEGLRLFTGDAGCVRCHNGPLLSDGRYYRLGVGFGDKGRAAVTGKDEDLYKFRTPSLRDVARTAPYMHDGSRPTLFEVVEFYYRTAPTQGPGGVTLDIEPLLGQSFSEMDALVAFLESLSGEVPVLSPPDRP
jgi:cytochrome c peroxidase